jgi:hypothetical protein
MASRCVETFSACNACGETLRPLSSCAGCKKVRYCGKKCQKDDWKEHKEDCKKIATTSG